MPTLYLDLETYSETPIKHGAHRYAEDAEVLLIAWAHGDEPVRVWDCTEEGGAAYLEALAVRAAEADSIVIHNSAFDRTVLKHQGIEIPVEKITDTMVLALQHGLPGSLGMLCDVLGVPIDKAKDKAGKKLIQLFTKPRPKNMKLRRATRETHPDEWSQFVEYARLDVDAMRDIHKRLPKWNDNDSERVLWQLDQRINDRGIAVDREFARAAIRAFGRAGRSLATAASVLTDGAVTSTTQRQKVVDYLKAAYGLEVKDLTKASVEALLREDIPAGAKRLLEIRLQASATSPAKYGALIDAASSDGRLRGTMQFCGAARTGRDAGRIFQPQNLPRTPDWFDGDVQETTIAAIKADAEDLIWENVSERCSMPVRGALVAEPGNKLVIADLSNIEGRVLAWLANERWKIDAFKAYDQGKGPDLYKVTAARILSKAVEDVTKDERQNPGKVAELACGYGGGVGAFRVMGGARVDAMDDETISDIVRKWRRAHPATTKLWYALEGAVRDAIRDPSAVFKPNDLLQCDTYRAPSGDTYLRIRLPSGRYLCYLRPRIDETGKIIYEGVDQYTRKWTNIETYYGKLIENVVQAIARDVFMAGLRRAEAEGYRVVVRVHDELVCEVIDLPEFNEAGLAKLMATNPSWAEGLPLAAAGFETYRYRKD